MAKVFFAFPYEYDRSHPNFRVAFREATQSAGHEAVFADEVFRSGDILQHITECIEECYCSFFDITGLNPNVLVELGIGYSSQRSTFLLLNSALHVQEMKSFWGAKNIPIEIPADLRGLVRLEYATSADLSSKVRRALQQNPPEPTAPQLEARIKDHVKRYGPLNMSGIAGGISTNIEQVRPILRNLVAANVIEKLGSGRGTRYKLNS